MTKDQKVKKLLSKLKTDGEDLTMLSHLLENDYFHDEDIDGILADIIKIKDDIIASVAKLRKEIQ